MVHRLLAGLMALGFLVDPISGVFAWIHFEKAIVKGEARRHLISAADKNGLVVLEFSKMETESLLRWEHSREFEYDGQMYDVVESWAVGDTVHYRCWWDRAETRLNDRLRELAVRAFGDAPKIGDDEAFGRSLLRSPAFVVAPVWKTPGPRSVFRRLANFSEWRSSRSVRPLTPPPWPA
jgi:hypothetical protein